jgi:MFS transporter, ACS family, tartrate transporter
MDKPESNRENNRELDTPDHKALERSVVAKIMNRLIPFLAILYVFCLLDRTNVGIAALTMQKDLRFDDAMYGLGAGIFFIGYFIFEVPSNLIMQKVGARRWIARIMITWGLISAAMMFVKTPMSFYSLRFLLGLAEAGFYPGVLLYFTFWVPSSVRAQVLSRFLALSAILGLIGNPLGSILLKMHGLSGLAGWQWLFLLEGLPSAFLSIAVWKLLPDSPKEAPWMTEAEKAWLAERLRLDALEHPRIEHLTWKQALREPRIIHLCIIFIVSSTAINILNFFGPKIIKFGSGNLWDDSSVALINSVPAIVGAIAMLTAAKHSDKTGQRRMHVFVGYGIAALGFLMCALMPTTPGIILAMCVVVLGERVAAGSYWAVTTNLLGGAAAAGGLAFINSVGNLGGFIGPKIMGELATRNNNSFVPGLFLASALMVWASLHAFFTLKQRAEPEKNDTARYRLPD